MKLEIIVEEGVDQDLQAIFDKPGTYSVGRQAGNDLMLAGDERVSRQHCQIELTSEGVCTLIDTFSLGGTFVNGSKLTQKTPLINGDKIRVGQTTLRVSLLTEVLSTTVRKRSHPLPPLKHKPGLKIKLPRTHRNLLRRHFAAYEQIDLEREFGEGYSSAHVYLVTPHKGGVLAPVVVKIGPAPLIADEQRRYEQYVEEHLPLLAARLTHLTLDQTWGAVTYAYIGEATLGQATGSLWDYYKSHRAEQILMVLDRMLNVLGQFWYEQRQVRPGLTYFEDFYSSHFPGDLLVTPEVISPQPLPADPAYLHLPLETEDWAYREIRPGQRVDLADLQLAKQRPERLDLMHPDHTLRVWLELEPEQVEVPSLEQGQPVYVRGRVTKRRQDVLTAIVQEVFAGVAEVDLDPTADTVHLAGLAYPNPLTLYPTYFAQRLPSSLPLIHGDLHLFNILVDHSDKAWLIDFGQVGPGHAVFDFIELETHLRNLALRDKELSLAARIDFE